MGFPSGKTAIVGVYTTKQAKSLKPRTSVSLEIEAIRGALDDAGLTPQDVDGVVPLNHAPYGVPASVHMFWAEQLGEHPLTFMEIGIAAGGLAKAAAAIDAGMANVVVLFWGKAGYEIGPRGTAVADRAPRTTPWHWDPSGATCRTWYAMWAQRYMHEFGVTNEDLAEVAVTHRYHATLNPDSVMGSRGEITVDDVHREPVRRPNRCTCSTARSTTTAATRSSSRRKRSRAIAASPRSGCSAAPNRPTPTSTQTINDPWFPDEGKAVRRTADIAFAQAGVSRDDIDVAGLYDCYTVTMLRDLEEMGFCKLGEGAELLQRRPHPAGWIDAVQHRRRPAVEQPQHQPVGHAHDRGGAAAARRMRRAAGRERQDRRLLVAGLCGARHGRHARHGGRLDYTSSGRTDSAYRLSVASSPKSENWR